ncbi:MAG: hypothetical protein ACTMIA_14565 [Vibrio sp.]
MNNETEKDFNLGGSIDTALSGQYQLSITQVFKEAWDCTIKHFLSFSPAIILLAILQLAIFFVALHFQVANVTEIFVNFAKNGKLPDGFMRSLYIANFSYEVISAPFYAGVSLMAMSHAVGLSTTTKQIGSGLQYTISLIIVTLASLILQGVANLLVPVISLYLSLAFTNAGLLVCEKRIRPFNALWLSLRAANRKLLQLAVIYGVIMGLFLAALMFYGIGLVLVLPFFFHVKGIIYRNMFGVRLKVVATPHDDDNGSGGEGNEDKTSQVFNA